MDALIKVTIVFIGIIILQRFKIALTWIIFLAALVIGPLFNLSLLKTLKTILIGATSEKAIYLFLVLYMIAIMEAILRTTGALKEITTRLNEVVRNPLISGSTLPALLGLLPSAGGARFSAPLTSSALENTSFKPGEKVFINYWFRHIWEPFLPIYPALILAVSIVPLVLSSFITRNVVFSLLMFLIGWLVIYRKNKINKFENDYKLPSKKILENIKRILLIALPILIPVIAVITFKNGTEVLLYSLIMVVLGLLIFNRMGVQKSLGILKEAFKIEILLLVGAVLAFKEVLEVSGSLNLIGIFFQETGFTPLPIFILLPLITGLLTGISQAYVGITFPLLKMLLPEGANILSWYSTAYLAGFMGVMLSPVHLCLILTKDYFKTKLFSAFPYLFQAAIPMLLIIWLTFYFI